MEQKTRVEKYKKHRDEISKMDTYRFDSPYAIPEDDFEEENDIAMNEDTLQKEHIKKSTLSISLDQLIKAHEEYTVMISQEEIKRKNKEEQKVKLRKIRNIAVISGIIVLLIAILILLIVILLNK
jgi:tRNA A37 threonylcarbamoyladenosine biosynthesis protein TsaE